MCLVQRVISVLLYGNATHKEVDVLSICILDILILYVFRFTAFMICMSSSATSLIDKVSDDYNIEVFCWRDKLKDRINVRSITCVWPYSLIFCR